MNAKAAQINAQVIVGTVLRGKFDILYTVVELGDKSVYVIQEGRDARLTLNRRSLHNYTLVTTPTRA